MKDAAPPLAEGRYQLISVLGVGGMATVYRGFDARLQVHRAIKVLSPALARRKSLRTRFEAEATTMAMLHHRHIVGVYDVGTDGNRTYIVMELVEGGSLLDRVREHGPLPPKMALGVTIKTLDALRIAHSKGVVHRDIKPHNILLTQDGDIRITDFGIAQMRKWEDDGLTKTGAVMGTWGFMAPEQRQDAKTVDARADVYSTGATLYSVLTDKTPVELFAADMDASMLDGIEPGLAEIIRMATRYSRDERYADATAMADACREVIATLPDDPVDTPPLALPVKVDTDKEERRPMPRARPQLNSNSDAINEEDAADVSEPDEPAPGGRLSELRRGTLVPAMGHDLDMITSGASSPSAPPPEDEELLPDPPSDEIAVRAEQLALQMPDDPPTPTSESPLTPVPVPVPSLPPNPTPVPRVLPDMELSGPYRLAPPQPQAPTRPGVEFWITAGIAVMALAALIVVLVTKPWQTNPVEPRVAVEQPVEPKPIPTPEKPPEQPPTEPTPSEPIASAEPPKNPPSTNPVGERSKAKSAGSNGSNSAGSGASSGTPPPEQTTVQVIQNPPTPAAPTILHKAPLSAKVGSPLTLNVQLPSDDWKVTLYFKATAGGGFNEKIMRGQGGLFGAQIDVTPDMAGGLSYFIKAVPMAGGEPLSVGDGFHPKLVAVPP